MKTSSEVDNDDADENEHAPDNEEDWNDDDYAQVDKDAVLMRIIMLVTLFKRGESIRCVSNI